MLDRESAEATRLTRIGPYRVVRELGRGGMGIVYEAQHELLQRRVAIKLLRAELARDPVHVQRFVREGRAACNIRHPHVIDVYEFDFADGAPYLVMDLLEGRTLAELLQANDRLALPDLFEVLLPVLSAVSAAHAQGIVHRDLKPSNVMLARSPDGRVVPKVLDFGTSKLLAQQDLTLTESAAFIGTPYYMAPEQVRAARDVDARCDQYALGVMLYECATGRRPFEAESSYDVLHALMSAPLAAPSTLNSALPAAFDSAVMRAMQRDPARRFSSVRALGAALLELAPLPLAQRWRSEFTPAEAEPPARVDQPAGTTLAEQPRPARWRRRSLVGLSVLAALAAAAAWSLSQRTEHVAPASEPPAAVASPAPAPPEAPASTALARMPEPAPPAAESGGAPAVSLPAQAAPPRPARPRARPVRASAPQRPQLGDNGAPILE